MTSSICVEENCHILIKQHFWKWCKISQLPSKGITWNGFTEIAFSLDVCEHSTHELLVIDSALILYTAEKRAIEIFPQFSNPKMKNDSVCTMPHDKTPMLHFVFKQEERDSNHRDTFNVYSKHVDNLQQLYPGSVVTKRDPRRSRLSLKKTKKRSVDQICLNLDHSCKQFHHHQFDVMKCKLSSHCKRSYFTHQNREVVTRFRLLQNIILSINPSSCIIDLQAQGRNKIPIFRIPLTKKSTYKNRSMVKYSRPLGYCPPPGSKTLTFDGKEIAIDGLLIKFLKHVV